MDISSITSTAAVASMVHQLAAASNIQTAVLRQLAESQLAPRRECVAEARQKGERQIVTELRRSA